MNRIFVTGAYGFIGKSLCQNLVLSNKSVIGAVRSVNLSLGSSEVKYVSTGDIDLNKNWKEMLVGSDCIIHCAARAHIISKSKNKSLEIYRLINVEFTKHLAEKAVEAGVKRFIFLSSIGVLGVDTNGREPFSIKDIPNPTEDYAISKYEAENILMEISAKTGLEIVILRLPLVYGQGAPGNIKRLLKLISMGLPLPFGLIRNQRSFIGLDNLINLLIHCIDHPIAANKIFLVSDGEDLSTPDLLNYIATAMGRSLTLVSFPLFLLKFICYSLGLKKEISRMTGSLQVDSSQIRDELNWTPPISLVEGIRRMAQGR
jgi:nucleoside-diphosphate-sugar epimerase